MNLLPRSLKLFEKFSEVYRKVQTDQRIYMDEPQVELEQAENKIERIESTLLNQLEKIFSADFKDVKIHTGSHADQITAFHDAEAVTIGSDIYFADGNYAPHDEEGISLLIHELQHVVQSKIMSRMMYKEDIESLEHKAAGAEGKVEEKGLHAMELNSLSDNEYSGFQGHGPAGALTKEMGDKGSGDEVSLAEYSGMSGQQVGVTIQFRDGSTVQLSQGEYMELRKKVKEEVLQHVSEQQAQMTGEDYESYLLKFSNYVTDRKVM